MKIFELLKPLPLREWYDTSNVIATIHLVLTDDEDIDPEDIDPEDQDVKAAMAAVGATSIKQIALRAKSLGDPNEDDLDETELRKSLVANAKRGFIFAYTTNMDGYNPIVLTKTKIRGEADPYVLPNDIDTLVKDFN